MADNSDLLPYVDRLKTARVLCIGDVMLDHYVYGQVERVSPEAPIPVLWIEREMKTLGGAGNVLRNLRALGAAASFISVVGNDEAGREIGRLVEAQDGAEAHVLVQPQRTTTVKTRYIAGNQQLLRADRESAIPLDPYIREDLLRLARELVADHSVVVISDYAKGVLTEGVALEIIRAAREAGARVIVDPKGGDHIRYRGADLVKPNRRELAHATGMPVATDDEIIAASRALIERCGFNAVLASLGAEGSVLIVGRRRGPYSTRRSPRGLRCFRRRRYCRGDGRRGARGRRRLDRCGSPRKCRCRHRRRQDRHRSGVCERAHRRSQWPGSATPRTRSCRARTRSIWWRAGAATGSKSALPTVASTCCTPGMWRCSGKPRRHAIGSSSGSTVMRRRHGSKGPRRPIQSETERAAVLASLAAVDLIVVFEEDTPMELIRDIRPQLLVKGDDYRLDEVVGADFVKHAGGEVLLAKVVPGYSTTATIARLAS